MGARLPQTFVQVAQLAADAGFTGYQVTTMVAISKAESNHDAYAIGVVDNPTSPAHRSIDVGLWQINSYWWPTVLLAVLLDPAGNAGQARKVFESRFNSAEGGYTARVRAGYAAWHVYTSGAHKQFIAAADEAARTIGAYG